MVNGVVEFFLDSTNIDCVHLASLDTLIQGDFVITTVPGQRFRTLTPFHLFQQRQGNAFQPNGPQFGQFHPQAFTQPIFQQPQMAPAAWVPIDPAMYSSQYNQAWGPMMDSQPSIIVPNGQGPASMYPLEIANAMPMQMQAPQHYPVSTMEPNADEQRIASPVQDGASPVQDDASPVQDGAPQEMDPDALAAIAQAALAISAIVNAAARLAANAQGAMNGSNTRGRNRDRIRRPPNAFMLFRSYYSRILREENGRIQNSEICKSATDRSHFRQQC
ncbi:hypothetical protein GGR58DRAFT_471293 [Xylaria digitata]|nr:hypothetical protein GGR58DRAFT_471293 [Xylaria digitata]